MLDMRVGCWSSLILLSGVYVSVSMSEWLLVGGTFILV